MLMFWCHVLWKVLCETCSKSLNIMSSCLLSAAYESMCVECLWLKQTDLRLWLTDDEREQLNIYEHHTNNSQSLNTTDQDGRDVSPPKPPKKITNNNLVPVLTVRKWRVLDWLWSGATVWQHAWLCTETLVLVTTHCRSSPKPVITS